MNKMALTPEQIEELKEQLREQVKDLPQQQKEAALNQIASLSPQALEAMIKQQQEKSGNTNKPQKGVFRSIVDGDIKAYVIAENKDALAVLDIKPVSNAHIVIIPKKPVTEAKSLPNSCFNLSKKIAKRISKKLEAKSSEIQTEYKFGEMIINVIPIYDKSLNLLSPRTDANEKQLQELEQKLKIVKKRIKKIKIGKKAKSEGLTLKLERRIP